MSYQQNIREQITNRCSRIAKLVKLNAAGIIINNEQRQLDQLLGHISRLVLSLNLSSKRIQMKNTTSGLITVSSMAIFQLKNGAR